MDIVVHLAMTAAEFQKNGRNYPHIAWMACHFSPYGTGLSNLPGELPKGSLLMVNDRTPVSGHDPTLIAAQLQQIVEEFTCDGIILDFQRQADPQTRHIAAAVGALPFPVAVTPAYAEGIDCAVFLPPIPMTTPPEDYLSQWKGREIWLEAATEYRCIRVTPAGSRESEAPQTAFPCPHIDENLHCRYGMDIHQAHVDFHLQRDGAQLQALLAEAKERGVCRFIGLYQQLHSDWDQCAAADTARFQA